jgi:beta-xylosidase
VLMIAPRSTWDWDGVLHNNSTNWQPHQPNSRGIKLLQRAAPNALISNSRAPSHAGTMSSHPALASNHLPLPSDGGGFNPDPSITRVGSHYYLTTSTFEYFPGLPLYHARSPRGPWRLIGHALTRADQLTLRTPEPGGGVWAPTLRFHGGWLYLATAAWERYRPQADDRVWPRGFWVRARETRVRALAETLELEAAQRAAGEEVWTTRIDGVDDEDGSAIWSAPVPFDVLGFDQDLFWDEDGTVYLSTTVRKRGWTPAEKRKGFAIHVCSVDMEMGRSTSELKMIRESVVGSGVAEGSHIIKRGRYYYLFTAEGGTESGHSECVSRSTEGPFGPWEVCPHNPLLASGTGDEDEVQNTGHADLVEDEQGQWWAVFLAVRPMRVDEGGQRRWETSVFGKQMM